MSKEHFKLTYPDKTTLEVIASGGQAAVTYRVDLKRRLDSIRRDHAALTGTCCQQLSDRLGKHDGGPLIVYIGQAAISSGKWYHGVTEPGYYRQFQVLAKPGEIEGPAVTYFPLTHCPYCQADLSRVHIAEMSGTSMVLPIPYIWRRDASGIAHCFPDGQNTSLCSDVKLIYTYGIPEDDTPPCEACVSIYGGGHG